MKKLYVIILYFVCLNSALSQVGIGTTNPDATLDIKSSNQFSPSNTDGILIPKIDNFPFTNPTAAQNGMMVFLNTTSAAINLVFIIGITPLRPGIKWVEI